MAQFHCDVCVKTLTTSSKHPVDVPQNYVVGQQRQQMSELQFDGVQIVLDFLTHDVHHGLNGMCVKSCFIFSDSEGSSSLDE